MSIQLLMMSSSISVASVLKGWFFETLMPLISELMNFCKDKASLGI